MSILTTIGGLFAKDAVQETVLDLVRDVTGLNNLSERERLEHERERIRLLTEYQRATRHQSKMRRLIALAVTGLMVLFVLAWFIAQVIGTTMDIKEGVYLAARIKTYYEEVLLMPTNIVLGFYFGVQAVNSFSSRGAIGGTNGKPD